MTTKKVMLDLLDESQSFRGSQVKLYLITRHLRSGVRRNTPILDKYAYQYHAIRLQEDLREDFLDVVQGQIRRFLGRDNVEVAEYQPIDDDAARVLTYELADKGLPFAAMAKDQLEEHVDTRPVQDLDFVDDVWAYAVVLRQRGGQPLIAFRKMPKTKVCVAEGSQDFMRRALMTVFRPQGATLEKLKGTTVGFDTRIDCILYGETFFIFSKAGFEKIAGLDEEFHAHAETTVGHLEDSNLIQGIDLVRQSILMSPNLMKRIAKLYNDPIVQTLTPKRLGDMQRLAAQYKEALKVKGGKVILETKADVELLVKLLNDYFLKSDLTGNRYGSYAKRPIL